MMREESDDRGRIERLESSDGGMLASWVLLRASETVRVVTWAILPSSGDCT